MKTLFLFLLSIGFFCLPAQIILSGTVRDAASGELIPYANLYLLKKQYGSTCNEEGKFSLQTNIPDTLIVMMGGYVSEKIYFSQSQSNLKITLERNNLKTKEIVIHRKKGKKKNPADVIMEQVLAHKKKNNYKSLSAYECKNYTKIQFNLNNLDSTLSKNLFFEPIGFLFKKIDSTTFGKPSVPIMLSETSSDYFYKSDPKHENEIIQANKISGIKKSGISEFTGNFYLDYNLYNDYIFTFNKNFVSPLATHGKLSYKYVLLDSTEEINGRKTYEIFFSPKRKQELTFRGHLWIDSATWAIAKAKLVMSHDANVNLIHQMEIEKYFQLIDSAWLPEKETLFMEFSVNDDRLGIYGLKQTFSSSYLLRQPKPDAFFSTEKIIRFNDSLQGDKEEYWQTQRENTITKNEKEIYTNVDSAMNTPYLKKIKKISILLYTGYLPFKKWHYGPVLNTYSFNPIEGNRFRIGGETNSNFSKKFRVNSYVAYGTLDRKIKYGLKAEYYFKLQGARRFAGIDFSNDLKVMNLYGTAIAIDNILASISRRNAPKYLFVERYAAYFENEWLKGTGNRITFAYQNIHPLGNLIFEKPDNTFLSEIKTVSLEISGRIAWHEKFFEDHFTRLSLSTKAPIITYSFESAFKGLLNADYNYYKAKIKVSDKWFFGNIGYMHFNGEAGKIWGSVPYPLLFTQAGNNSWYFDPEAFSLMNPFEFVNDQYVKIMLTQHFEGLLLNKIPFLRKLDWREVAFARGAIGALSAEHTKILKLPVGMSGLNTPYIEAGVGIENIFKLFRIDAVWRLTQLNKTNVSAFGVNVGMSLVF
jgi:hypothetical protein